jgi:hypothetical protein
MAADPAFSKARSKSTVATRGPLVLVSLIVLCSI